jgi:hypothetical protein
MYDRLANLHLSFGPTTPSLARVQACLPVEIDIPSDAALVGEIVGPRCRFARTLESTTPFRRLTPRHDFVAEAILPDPCFWSDEVPMLYTAHFRLQQAGATVETAGINFGIPAIDGNRGSIYRQGKRWVPRGVYADASSFARDPATLKRQLAVWREASAVLCVVAPSDELCAAASEWGVWMIAEIEQGDESTVCRQLARLSRHAAVFMAILPRDVSATSDMVGIAPNVLLAEPFEEAPSADRDKRFGKAACVVIDAEDVTQFAQRTRDRRWLPIFARRRLGEATGVSEARRQCDRLQADLAPSGDFAGYLV